MEINSLQNKTLSYTCICHANGDNFLPTKAFSNHLHKRIYGDSSSIKMTFIAGAASTNTVNIVNKLVTIFAGHLDSCIVTNNQPERLKTTVTSGSGQINVQMTLIQFAGTCKNCAIPSSLPGQFPG